MDPCLSLLAKSSAQVSRDWLLQHCCDPECRISAGRKWMQRLWRRSGCWHTQNHRTTEPAAPWTVGAKNCILETCYCCSTCCRDLALQSAVCWIQQQLILNDEVMLFAVFCNVLNSANSANAEIILNKPSVYEPDLHLLCRPCVRMHVRVCANTHTHSLRTMRRCHKLILAEQQRDARETLS